MGGALIERPPTFFWILYRKKGQSSVPSRLPLTLTIVFCAILNYNVAPLGLNVNHLGQKRIQCFQCVIKKIKKILSACFHYISAAIFCLLCVRLFAITKTTLKQTVGTKQCKTT